MTLIEALSCGTPVVSFNTGATPEIVLDKQTGFILDNKESLGFTLMKEAVQKIYNMPTNQYLSLRQQSRKHIEKNFTVNHMVSRIFAVTR